MFLRDGILWSLAAVLLLAEVSPPLQACDGGTAVPDPGNNPGLVEDCKVLLALRDELADTGSLNWDTQLAITSWEGVGVSGAPRRVSKLELYENQLTGSLPAELGRLTNLQALHLAENQLTGAIPVELGRLIQLQAFSFRDNQLTGPVPPTLRHLPDVYVSFRDNLVGNWVGPGRMHVTWDEPGDSTVSYTYRLWKTTSGSWTDWAEILETTLRAGEGVTIEWMLTGLPTDVAHTYISVRARNKNGLSPEARARVGPLEVTTRYFPDYVDGGGWSVQLALSHIAAATEDAEIIVTAYDQEGQPIPGYEPPRDFRRLHFLRGWGHGKTKQILTRG